MADRWVVSDNSNPVRRTAFGSAEQARSFADGLPGWSVIDNDDPRWLPMVGEAGGPTAYRELPPPSSS